jgi:RNA polymerase sigma-70 factor (ECF subfamily)
MKRGGEVELRVRCYDPEPLPPRAESLIQGQGRKVRSTGIAAISAQLYRLHAPSAVRCARRLLHSEADACEVVHDVFLSLLQKPGQYSGVGTFRAFLHAAVRHASLNRLRRHTTDLRIMREVAISIHTGAFSPNCPERATTLSATLRQLPRPLAMVAVYYHLQECTHDEIAQKLGCSRRHVGDLIERLASWYRHEGAASSQPMTTRRTLPK